jgi:hypothetical protein
MKGERMNTHVADINILDHLVVVNLDVHIWSARRKLMPEDLGNAELPPEELASLGSKRICNPDALKHFSTLKARAVSMLERNGVRFLNGWAIPVDRMEQIAGELAAVRDDFNNARDKFLLCYEQAVREWMDLHPQWASIIANSVVSEEHVRSRMAFKWQMFRIVPPAATARHGDLRDDIDRLGDTLFGEVAKTATETWHRCYAGKTEITRKALSPLKAILDKLTGLSFMEPRAAPVAELIRTAFTYIQKRGPIRGGTLILLQGLVALLRSPADLLEHAQKILEGNQTPSGMLEGFIGDTVWSVPQYQPLAETEDPPCAEPDFTAEPSATLPVLESCGLW